MHTSGVLRGLQTLLGAIVGLSTVNKIKPEVQRRVLGIALQLHLVAHSGSERFWHSTHLL